MPDRKLIKPDHIVGENDSRSLTQIEKDFWANTKNKDIQREKEQIVFHLTPEEAQKCRFTKPDKNMRMAECTIHTRGMRHGVRMFPPHLWNWENGKIYHKTPDGKWAWWTADVKQNLTRFDD